MFTEAFSSFSTNDMARTVAFYRDTLGLDVREEAMGIATVMFADGGRAIIYPKPDHRPATFTVLGFPVPDIEAAVDELTARGVTFDHYEGTPLETDERGIFRGPPEAGPGAGGPLIAWFTDPAGNILSIVQEG